MICYGLTSVHLLVRWPTEMPSKNAKLFQNTEESLHFKWILLVVARFCSYYCLPIPRCNLSRSWVFSSWSLQAEIASWCYHTMIFLVCHASFCKEVSIEIFSLAIFLKPSSHKYPKHYNSLFSILSQSLLHPFFSLTNITDYINITTNLLNLIICIYIETDIFGNIFTYSYRLKLKVNKTNEVLL